MNFLTARIRSSFLSFIIRMCSWGCYVRLDLALTVIINQINKFTNHVFSLYFFTGMYQSLLLLYTPSSRWVATEQHKAFMKIFHQNSDKLYFMFFSYNRTYIHIYMLLYVKVPLSYFSVIIIFAQKSGEWNEHWVENYFHNLLTVFAVWFCSVGFCENYSPKWAKLSFHSSPIRLPVQYSDENREHSRVFAGNWVVNNEMKTFSSLL